MGHRETIVVAMSGGVDSSVSAAILVEQGFEVVGLFMRSGIASASDSAGSAPVRPACCSLADANDARLVAGKLRIPFYVLDFSKEFEGVIGYFADEYARGRTPNPCVVCNEELKFGRLLQYAVAIGADGVATGHYARIEARDERPRLLRGIDPGKDQSYVLFGLPADVLGRTRFPIGGMTKADVRRKAGELALPVYDKPDSADICFAPDRDYARIIRPRRPEAFQPGEVRDEAGRVVGRHEGIGHYTIGQRHGLGIAMGVPYYVTGIDPQTNTVMIGPRERLLCNGLVASRVRWLIDEPARPFRADVQIRYTHKAAPAVIEVLPDKTVRAVFETPQSAVTPGQAAVFYDGDAVLGGGWIDVALN